jgi:hypothetical protein
MPKACWLVKSFPCLSGNALVLKALLHKGFQKNRLTPHKKRHQFESLLRIRADASSIIVKSAYFLKIRADCEQGCIEMAVSADSGKRIIRNIKDLPDWFTLGKYRAAEGLDAAGWYEILLQRWNHFFWLDRDGPEEYASDRHEGKNYYYDALLQSRNDPLSLLTDDVQILLIGGGRLQALKYDKKDFSTFSHAISPFTIRRLYQLEHRLKKPTRTRIRAWCDDLFDKLGEAELTEDFKAECKWALSFIDAPIFEAFEKEGKERSWPDQRRGHDCVYVDLTVPDKILIQQFTDYLRQVRRRYPDIKPANPYKTPEYKKWLEYGLLPYLDLKLWEIENNVSIPHRVLADAIFPEGNKGEEMIRKTTKKIADQVMKDDYIDFLAIIAAQEIAEKI